MVIPESAAPSLQTFFDEQKLVGAWMEKLAEQRVLIRTLTAAEKTEGILTGLEQRFAAIEGFRVILFPIEASIPRPEMAEEPVTGWRAPENANRISRDELYDDIEDSAKITPIFVVLAILSSVVAAIGLLDGNVAVIIGAMVISPLLGPNVALSFATTLGDVALAKKSLRANGIGIFVSLLLALLLGLMVDIDPGAMPEIASRARVSLSDVALAFASGGAGALAFTTALPVAMVGVAVSVALLPPLVTLGLLLGAGFIDEAINALLLLLINIICVNLAGVIAFFAQGIRPLTWWEVERAKKATILAVVTWIILLAILVAGIYYAKKISWK